MKKGTHFSCILIATVSLLLAFKISAQSIRLDNLKDQFGKGKMLKIGGGLSANGIYYNGNGGYGRDPFSYFVNGNIVLNLYGLVNLPFSFTLSDFGKNYTYPIPPNRFSIHPSYKWLTGHIGNISMTFSPYTLNGYLFSGVGFDADPGGSFKGSIIYGRLQRAVEYDTANRITPAAYERLGFGTKVQFQRKNYRAGMIVFRAWDDVHSIHNKPDSIGIFPMENTVLSLSGGAKIVKELDFTVEWATSALTQDVRADASEGTGVLGHVVNAKASTGFYNAIKSNLQYTLATTLLGVGYERVDPGYRTLGAYYLNNDLENITVNVAQPLFKNKVQVAINVGQQRDNLNGDKSGSSRRTIGSANLSYNPTERLSATFSYSNFQTYMRILPLFRIINQLDDFQNMDTLNYTQVSINANSSLNYTIRQSEAFIRTLSIDLSFQETADKQGGVIRNGNDSQFYNASMMYNSMQIARGMNFSGAFNMTYNTIGRNDFITFGPTVGCNAKIWEKKISTGLSASYNASKGKNSWESSVLNVRCNAVYTLVKHHVLSLIVLNQLRRSSIKDTNDLTVTLGYNFKF